MYNVSHSIKNDNFLKKFLRMQEACGDFLLASDGNILTSRYSSLETQALHSHDRHIHVRHPLFTELHENFFENFRLQVLPFIVSSCEGC